MKLRNKKTGEIREIQSIIIDKMFTVESLAELIEAWEDYEEPETFWYITTWGDVKEYSQDQFAIKQKQEIGNYFETEEEAEKAAEKLKAWTRLKDKGLKFTGWYSSGDTTNTIRICAEFPDAELGPIVGSDLDLLFGGEE